MSKNSKSRITKKGGAMEYSELGNIIKSHEYINNPLSTAYSKKLTDDSKTKIIVETSSDDHVYVNVSIVNNSVVESIIAQTNAPRSTVIVENPSNYYMSVIRFFIPLQELPIFIFLDNTYSVTISNGVLDFQTFLIFVPDFTTNISPPQPPPFNRYVYSYEQFLTSINNALSTSFIASGLPGVAPYMIYNPVTQLISLIAPASFHNAGFNDQNQPIKVWFNTSLYTFFGNFNKLFNGYPPSPVNINGKNFNIIIKPTGENEIIIPASFGGPLAGLQMTQEYFALSNWNDFRSLVITTTSIPIRAEIIPSGLISGNGNGSPGTQVGYRPILTDFELIFNQAGDTQSFAQYFPPGEYRLVDLLGSTPLKNIDLQFWFQNRNLELFPILIGPLKSLDIKMIFRKKSKTGALSYYN